MEIAKNPGWIVPLTILETLNDMPEKLFMMAMITLVSMAVACSGGSEERGRIRVNPSDVAGVYESGSERLELRADGTYVQDVVSGSQSLHHTGRWRILNHFLDGSEVIIINAAVISPATPDDKEPHTGFGDLPMYVHKRSGKVALARNEIADWYYERSQ